MVSPGRPSVVRLLAENWEALWGLPTLKHVSGVHRVTSYSISICTRPVDREVSISGTHSWTQACPRRMVLTRTAPKGYSVGASILGNKPHFCLLFRGGITTVNSFLEEKGEKQSYLHLLKVLEIFSQQHRREGPGQIFPAPTRGCSAKAHQSQRRQKFGSPVSGIQDWHWPVRTRTAQRQC